MKYSKTAGTILWITTILLFIAIVKALFFFEDVSESERLFWKVYFVIVSFVQFACVLHYFITGMRIAREMIDEIFNKMKKPE